MGRCRRGITLHGEGAGRQDLLPAPQSGGGTHLIPPCYSLAVFRSLPWKRQKDCAFKCKKALEADAFGEAPPFSSELKANLQRQIDEMDQERRRRTIEGQDAPLPPPKRTLKGSSSSWRGRSGCDRTPSKERSRPVSPSLSSSRHRVEAPVKKVFPPLPSTSSSPLTQMAPPRPPPPAVSPQRQPSSSSDVTDREKRSDLDFTCIKKLIQEKADLLMQQVIAANEKKASLQEQSRVAHARARKAEWARATLDQSAEIILELIDKSVDWILKEAAILDANAAAADAKARELFAEASAMQGTSD
jgi:hypothetical protein